MTTNPPSPQRREQRSLTVTPMGGMRLRGLLKLPSRLTLVTLIGGMDLDLRDAELPPEGVTITKVSPVGGVSILVPGHVRVEVGGFTLLGGKNIERRPDLAPDAPVVRVHAFGLVGGVKVRVAS